jgi:hypothetical protein
VQVGSRPASSGGVSEGLQVRLEPRVEFGVPIVAELAGHETLSLIQALWGAFGRQSGRVELANRIKLITRGDDLTVAHAQDEHARVIHR